MSIKLLTKKIEFKEFVVTIKKYNFYFDPPISQERDIEQWCSKIFKKAELDFYTSDKGAFVGLAAYYCNNFIDHEAYLTLILIDSYFQNQGFAKLIFKNVLINCKSKGMRILKLECKKSNLKAIRFYLSLNGSIYSENSTSFFYTFSI